MENVHHYIMVFSLQLFDNITSILAMNTLTIDLDKLSLTRLRQLRTVLPYEECKAQIKIINDEIVKRMKNNKEP